MKTIIFQILALFIIGTGCKSKIQKQPISGAQILIAEFAHFTDKNGDPISGEYDSEDGSFVPCSTDTVLSVLASQIKIIPDGSCDETPRNLNKRAILIENIHGTKKVISREINVDTVKKVGTYKVNGNTMEFHLNTPSMKRLRSEPKLTKSILKR